MTRYTLLIAAVLSAAALSACDSSSDTATSTPAPKSAPASPQAVPLPIPGAAQADAPAAEENITWTLPAGWKENPEPKPMRIATLLSDTNVEISITGFGGTVGGPLMNINRWRGQVNLGEITEAALPTATTQVPTASGQASLLDVTNPNPTEPDKARIIAASIPGKSKTFFIKMGPGPKDRLEQAKLAFLELLKTVKVSQ